jgi:hypothetical protein
VPSIKEVNGIFTLRKPCLLVYQPGELEEWRCRNPDNIRKPGLIGP